MSYSAEQLGEVEAALVISYFCEDKTKQLELCANKVPRKEIETKCAQEINDIYECIGRVQPVDAKRLFYKVGASWCPDHYSDLRECMHNNPTNARAACAEQHENAIECTLDHLIDKSNKH